MTQDKLIGGAYSDLPPSTEELRSGCRKLSEDVQASTETNAACGPLPGQCVNIDLLPIEVRLQIIQRERSRKELFRRKNKAAAVIQRAWRSYQLRKHLSHLLHMRQLGAGNVLRYTQETTALLLQVWRKELQLQLPKAISVSRTSKSPSKGISGKKSTRHSVLRQIYGYSQEGKARHPIRSSKALPVLHLSSVNSVQSIHLENSGRSRNFSYNLQSASQSKNKPKL